jgi:Zn finger protein HypA/HybF involved in hydrogenase expression
MKAHLRCENCKHRWDAHVPPLKKYLKVRCPECNSGPKFISYKKKIRE